MKTVKVKVYELHELNDDAKEKAREWAREYLDWDWWDCIFDDAKQVGLKIEGFDLYRGRSIEYKTMTMTPRESARAIVENHGTTCETYKEAMNLYATYREAKTSTADERERGETIAEEYFYALAQEYLAMLDREWDYMNTYEYLDEHIEANGYTFTKEGKRFG